MANTYKEATEWFRSGKIGFDELLAIVRHLPPPEPFIHTDTEDLYRKSEQEPDPNSADWLTYLLPSGLVDREQVIQLAKAANV
jgi:hypothetical protein